MLSWNTKRKHYRKAIISLSFSRIHKSLESSVSCSGSHWYTCRSGKAFESPHLGCSLSALTLRAPSETEWRENGIRNRQMFFETFMKHNETISLAVCICILNKTLYMWEKRRNFKKERNTIINFSVELKKEKYIKAHLSVWRRVKHIVKNFSAELFVVSQTKFKS